MTFILSFVFSNCHLSTKRELVHPDFYKIIKFSSINQRGIGKVEKLWRHFYGIQIIFPSLSLRYLKR